MEIEKPNARFTPHQITVKPTVDRNARNIPSAATGRRNADRRMATTMPMSHAYVQIIELESMPIPSGVCFAILWSQD